MAQKITKSFKKFTQDMLESLVENDWYVVKDLKEKRNCLTGKYEEKPRTRVVKFQGSDTPVYSWGAEEINVWFSEDINDINDIIDVDYTLYNNEDLNEEKIRLAKPHEIPVEVGTFVEENGREHAIEIRNGELSVGYSKMDSKETLKLWKAMGEALGYEVSG